MVMIAKNIENIGERFQAFVTAFREFMEAQQRVVKDDLLNLNVQKDDELLKGIWMPVSDVEHGYRNKPGLSAVEGIHKVLVVGHLRVPADATARDVQAKEFAMIEELKAFVRSGVPRMTISLMTARGSRQLEHPYGWVYAELELGPNPQGTH
jgi:hypothetical protein